MAERWHNQQMTEPWFRPKVEGLWNPSSSCFFPLMTKGEESTIITLTEQAPYGASTTASPASSPRGSQRDPSERYTFIHVASPLTALHPFLRGAGATALPTACRPLSCRLLFNLSAHPALPHRASCSSGREKKASLSCLQTTSLSGTAAPMPLCGSSPHFIRVSTPMPSSQKGLPKDPTWTIAALHSVTPAPALFLFLALPPSDIKLHIFCSFVYFLSHPKA